MCADSAACTLAFFLAYAFAPDKRIRPTLVQMHVQVTCMSCVCGFLTGRLHHLNYLGTSGDAVNGHKLRQLDERLAPRTCCGDGVVDHAQCIVNQG